MIDIGVNLTHKSLKNNVERIIDDALAVNVTHQIVTGADVLSSKEAVELSKKHKGILYATVGVHPHEVKDCDETTLTELNNLIKEDVVVAVGECGLDYERCYSEVSTQITWFEEQLAIADEHNMPVFLHSRGAFEDFVSVLNNFPNVHKNAIVHCFTGSKNEAEQYLKMGMSIGVTGWICDHRRNQDLLGAIKFIPTDKLLIETDAPYLIPKDLKVKNNQNEPKYLPHILNTIANLIGVDSKELDKITTENTKRLFRINI